MCTVPVRHGRAGSAVACQSGQPLPHAVREARPVKPHFVTTSGKMPLARPRCGGGLRAGQGHSGVQRGIIATRSIGPPGVDDKQPMSPAKCAVWSTPKQGCEHRPWRYFGALFRALEWHY